jgi:sulfur carrier protein
MMAGMKIVFKLYAGLTRFLPPAQVNNRLPMDLPDGTSVAQLIERFALPPGQVHLVLLNGVHVAPEERATRVLVDDDVLAIWPPLPGR